MIRNNLASSLAKSLALLLLLLPGITAGQGQEQEPRQIHRTEQIEVELLSETTSLAPGETTWLGLRLTPAEHWHTYWKMGGDSGAPTSMSEWQMPAGTIIGDIQWPAPHWLPFYDTGLINFGYEQEVILPISITLPEDFNADSVTLSTLAYWNVCEQLCIPGEERLSITLPITANPTPDETQSPRFQASRATMPLREHNINSLIATAGERVSLAFEVADELFANVQEAWFFPDQRRIIKPGPLRDVTIQPNFLQITHQQPRRMLDNPQVQGVLVTQDNTGTRTAYEFISPARDAASSTIMPIAATGGNDGSGTTPGTITGGLTLYILFALLGGLILNLMPCVFPVLSIKALSLAKNASETPRKQRLDGLAYTAGVILAFLLLATVLIALRAGGERIGWAFQFQHPWFLAFIIYLFFMMGLSLSGLFEIGTSLMGTGGHLTQRKGYQGSFFTGVLATIVATPCTAPFMGPALGFALSQPWLTAMLVFLALGLGMALPILLLSFIPILSRYLPQPGAWMETFKQFMAFPLYASALFFLWVLGNQVGVMGISLILAACILLAFAAWLYQRRLTMNLFMRTATTAIALTALITAAYVTQTPFMQTLATTSLQNESTSTPPPNQNFEPFSTTRLNTLRAAGRPVFVNMTADWCITCLANEQTSLSTDRVKQSMRNNNITYMKGDWTNENPEITAVLESFNRPSVPLYILYPGNPSAEPIILPQILTPGILENAFANVNTQ
ncbi:MAG: protein-disulfide reductase DsbD family protein [Pseudohongiellaceae bacterium]